MTIRYSKQVGNSDFGTFLKVLALWRGSVYKALWKEGVLFLLCYASLSCIYRFVLNDVQRGLKRYPTLDHLIESGFMTEVEKKMLEDFVPKQASFFWIPVHWTATLLQKAHTQGIIKSDIILHEMIKEVSNFVLGCRLLTYYDWVQVPLIYTQVVAFAVYSWVFACLIGRQYLDPTKGIPGHNDDFYVPIFTILEFSFYMGLLKVAESLFNPFGEDDDDFETNFIIDRNLKIGYAYVDDNHAKIPPVVPDLYYGIPDFELPQTAAYSIISKKPSTMPINWSKIFQLRKATYEKGDSSESAPLTSGKVVPGIMKRPRQDPAEDAANLNKSLVPYLDVANIDRLRSASNKAAHASNRRVSIISSKPLSPDLQSNRDIPSMREGRFMSLMPYRDGDDLLRHSCSTSDLRPLIVKAVATTGSGTPTGEYARVFAFTGVVRSYSGGSGQTDNGGADAGDNV